MQYSGSSGGGATDGSGYINDIYSAAADAALAQLKGSYDSSVLELDRNAEKLRGQYHDAENQASVQAALEKLNMNEQFAALGLNTGARGQLALSQSNALQSNLSGLEQQLMQGLADIDTQRAQLAAEYQSQVAEAIANNELEKAQALYNEYVRQDEAAQSQQQYLMQLQMQSREYDLSQAGSSAELARAQVDAMLKAGQTPSDALIAAAGYTPEYVNAMLAATRVSGGYGGSTSDSGEQEADDDTRYLPTFSDLMRTVRTHMANGDISAAREYAARYADYLSEIQWEELKEVIGV